MQPLERELQQPRRAPAVLAVREDVAELRVGVSVHLGGGRLDREVAPHARQALEADLVDRAHRRLPAVRGVLGRDAHGDGVAVDALEGVVLARVIDVDEELVDLHRGRQFRQVDAHRHDELQRRQVGAGDALGHGMLDLPPWVASCTACGARRAVHVMVHGAWCTSWCMVHVMVHGAWCTSWCMVHVMVHGAWCMVLDLQPRVELEEEELSRLLEEEVLDGPRVGVVDHQREARLQYAWQCTVCVTHGGVVYTLRCGAVTEPPHDASARRKRIARCSGAMRGISGRRQG
jgi:hypothetical protein